MPSLLDYVEGKVTPLEGGAAPDPLPVIDPPEATPDAPETPPEAMVDSGAETKPDEPVSTPPDPNAAPPDDASDYQAMVDYAESILGEKPAWLTKYTSMDDMLRGIAEHQRISGSALRESAYLRERGITQADLDAYMASKNGGQPAPTKPDDGFKREWVGGRDEKGNWLPSASAPADFADRLRRHLQGVSDAAFLDPSGEFFDKFLAARVQAEIEKATGQVRQESAAQQEAREAQTRQETWIKQNAQHIFVNKEPGGPLSPLGHKIVNLLWPDGQTATGSLIDPTASPEKRLQFAFDMVTAQARPAPASPPVPPRAGSHPTPAKGRTLTTAEYKKAYEKKTGQHFGLQQLMEAVGAGEVKDD
jgi:hypothetical protein